MSVTASFRSGTPLEGAGRPLPQLRWDAKGLIPAIAQERSTGEVLMLAWMNKEALAQTLQTGRACYWSRSRAELWFKGETSGERQWVHEIRVDCDGDALILIVDQDGQGACHTGHHSCFFRTIQQAQGESPDQDQSGDRGQDDGGIQS